MKAAQKESLETMKEPPKPKKPRAIIPLDLKYRLYEEAVQDTESDVDTLQEIYADLRKKKKPKTLREDFCGTFKLCCDWVKKDKNKKAYGVDLDPTPVDYGRKNHLSKLTDEQQSRVQIAQGNVLQPATPKTDLIVGFNFSYFIFKEREELKKYFRRCYQSLEDDGLFFLDHMGGSELFETNTDKEKVYKNKKHWFTYIWKQKTFDPISQNSLFTISFKMADGPKYKDAFTYDWRIWTLPELKDLLIEVGFKNVYFYFEDEDEEGDGNGEFVRRESEEEHEVWIAYLVASKS